MTPRLISTPLLSEQERALLLSLLVFTPKQLPALLQRLDAPQQERLTRQMAELPRVELKVLVVELRRMLDQRFEGLSQVHPSWLTAPIEQESPSIRAAWMAELPNPEGHTRRAPSHVVSLLRALFTKDLVEMPSEPKEKQLQRRHLADLPEAQLQRLLLFIQPQELGSALSDLGKELAQKLAQRLPKEQGELLLRGHQTPSTSALSSLLRAAEKSGLPLER